MTEERARRKLSGILSADAVGYSRLMQADEESTIRNLADSKELMAGLIQQYRGRVVDAPGDNLLAEFGSVVDATECAVNIQQELNVKNAELPENRRMDFRIGVNLGDVVEEADRIYGDGVNIAARIEGLAEPGGICISSIAFDQVKNKLKLGYRYLGEHSVKNIAEPVQVYKVLMEPEYVGRVIGEEKSKPKRRRWAALASAFILAVGAVAIWHFYFRAPPIEPASVEKMIFPLPDEPSIAVLPFDNMSGDPQQDYFSDGLSEYIITNLSKVPHLFVVARNSTFTYKGKPVKVQKVAEELGVRYVLEGSVQKTADRIRVSAQLIDAVKGHHLWAENYDRELKDIFAVQDKITIEILKALQVKLTGGEKASLIGKGTDNLEAYQKCLQGVEQLQRISKEGSIQARKLANEAMALDPKYATPYRILGWTHFNDARFGWSKSRSESFNRAVELAQKAIELDDTQAGAYSLLSMIYMFKRQYEKAITYGERAMSLSPNGAHFHAFQAIILSFAGRPKEAIELSKKAMRLSPVYPGWFLYQLGMAYRLTGQYDEAIITLKKCRDLNPEDIRSYTDLVIVYSQLGQKEEAHAVVSEILKKDPKFSLVAYAKSRFFKDPKQLDMELEALRKAGLPETPPLSLPDKPSIAVLAFVNLSGDPEQEYFSDGITEEIITALSKIPKLFVIARTSSFKYKGKDIDVRMVGRELGVRYVLEGSVRKAGEKVRITAQLIDAQTNNHIWAERYDRELKGIFTLQDEITMKVINALQVELTEGEHARLWGKGTDNLQAYLKSLRARELYLTQTRENNDLARRMAEEAIALDSEYAPPYHVLSITHYMDILFRTTKSPEQSMTRAVELIQKAIALDDSYALAHGWLGYLYAYLRKYEESIAEAQKCVALDLNGAHGYLYLCMVLRFAGRFEEAVQAIEKAIRLNPFPPNTYFRMACGSYFFVGRYEEAIAAGKKAVTLAPNDYIAHMLLATAYSFAGRQEEARIEAEEVLRLNPKFSIEFWGKIAPFKNQADREHVISALRKAGLPE